MNIRISRFAYVNKEGLRAIAKGKVKVKVVTKWEAMKGGYRYIGNPVDPETRDMIKDLAHPKNQQVYFEDIDILSGAAYGKRDV